MTLSLRSEERILFGQNIQILSEVRLHIRLVIRMMFLHYLVQESTAP